MTIGQTIKELRKKNDLTQEKLAEYLCVSYQAVSKWETGVSSPDLSLIGPLTKLLHVSADELLGLSGPAADQRRAELDAAFEKTWQTGDLEERRQIAETAFKEYPQEMKYLKDLAWATAMRSFAFQDDETYAAEQEKAIRYFAMVIEDCEDDAVRRSAILGITQYLSFRGRREEAKAYAALYPDGFEGKEDVLAHCLTGEEAVLHRQKSLDKSLSALVWSLEQFGTAYAYTLGEQLIRQAIPDGNYLFYHVLLAECLRGRASCLVGEKQYGKAVAAMEKALYHAREYDNIETKAPGTYRYTTPLLDKLEYDTTKLFRTGSTTQAEDFFEWLNTPFFDPLRDRVDFKNLLQSV